MTKELRLEDRKDALAHQVAALRGYAAKAVFQGECLAPQEEADQTTRMREFFTLGEEFRLTPKEMVAMIMAEPSAGKSGCGCHSCRSRPNDEA